MLSLIVRIESVAETNEPEWKRLHFRRHRFAVPFENEVSGLIFSICGTQFPRSGNWVDSCFGASLLNGGGEKNIASCEPVLHQCLQLKITQKVWITNLSRAHSWLQKTGNCFEAGFENFPDQPTNIWSWGKICTSFIRGKKKENREAVSFQPWFKLARGMCTFAFLW